MALSSKIKVPLPSSGLIVRGSGKYRYVYKVLSAFRTESGQPTNKRRAIGRLDADGVTLIPNDAYWEYYGYPDDEHGGSEPGQSVMLDKVRSIGAYFLVAWTLESLGVAAILRESFGPNRAAEIMTAVGYMACRGNVFEHVGDWCEEYTLGQAPLTSQSASALFASVTHGEKMSFFKEWARIQQPNECLAYDVTSFSSYASGIADTEWGHNRDREKLPQINLGCYLGQQSMLPVFYVTYPGSIVDKSHLASMMAYNEMLGISGECFVMDRGFCSAANIKYMHGKRLSYLIAAENGTKEAKAAISAVRDGIVSMRNNVGHGVYARAVHSRFYGAETTMHVYLDPYQAAIQREDLYRAVEGEEIKLHRLSQLTKREAKLFGSYFKIQLSDNGSFTFERDYGKIDAAAQNCGYFCFLTNKFADSAKALDIYRRKDMIEKGFDDIKNHIDMKRLRAHTSESTDGKMLCAFVALIAMSEIAKRLSAFNSKKPISKPSLILELEKIKIVYLSDGRRLMNPVTKTQREMLSACGASVDDLKASIDKK